MIFKRKPRLSINPDIVKAGDFPILVKDTEWMKMTSNIRNRNMNQLMNELNRLVQEMGKAKKNLQALKQRKKEQTQKILASSYLINEGNDDPEKMNRLEAERNELQKTSQQLESEQRKLEEIPGKVMELNLKLLEETASQVYAALIEHDKKNRKIEDKVQSLRKELDLLRGEKEMVEEQLETWYSFLHHLVGPREMEKLDQQITYQPNTDKKDLVE